jgi:uncharacterized protein (TIGR03437 family)
MKSRLPTKNLWTAFLLALLVPVLVYSYEFGPPDAHTGGFGEPTCTECHIGTLNNPSFGGRVTISVSSGSTPVTSYTSGATYTVTVTDFDAAQRRWGFELSARKQDATQAGTLQIGSDGFTQIANTATLGFLINPRIQYIEHTLAGTRLGTRDTGSGVSFTFTWTAPDVSAGPVVFNAAGNCENGDNTSNGDHVYSTSLTLQPQAAGPPAPAVGDNGTVNSASFAPGTTPLAPGSIATIFGTNLNDGSVVPVSAFGADGKLVTTLGGASVTLNGIPAPMFSSIHGSSFDQLSVQIPLELASATSASVVVTANGQTSAAKTVPLGPLSPGIFTLDFSGKGQGIIQIANTVPPILAAPTGSISGPARPVNRGEFLTIWCTGLGAVTNAPATGQPASASPLSETTTKPQISIGGVAAANVTFSGLTPNLVGLYQVNVEVPAGAPAGNAVPVVLTIGDVQANPLGPVTIAIAP